MERETAAQEVPNLSLKAVLVLSLFSFTNNASAVSIPVQVVSRFSEQPLTNEIVWDLDPREANPHQRRWALDRKVQLIGFEIRGDQKRGFRWKLGSLSANTEIFVRSSGGYYFRIEDFPCTKKPVGWYATREGTLNFAKKSAEGWSKAFRQGTARLAVRLSQMSSTSKENLQQETRQVFLEWLLGVEERWMGYTHSRIHSQGYRKIRAEEWQSYWDLARSENICKKKKKVRLREGWHSIIQSPATSNPLESKKIARAPSLRLDGQFTVRLSLDSKNVRTNGRFLIDFEREKSLISPDFIRFQGLVIERLQNPKSVPEKVVYRGRTNVVRSVTFDRVELGGKPIPLKTFLPVVTEDFTSVHYPKICCDGVLGRDFLKHFAVEFRPEDPAELVLWEKDGFSGTSGAQRWIEVSTNEKGFLESSCTARVGKKVYSGAKWAGGSVSGRSRFGAQVQCDGFVIAERAPLRLDSRFFLGVSFLSRGAFVFDLTNGRIWISEKARSLPFERNRSGLSLRYSSEKKRRVLRVHQIRSRSAASELYRFGLRKGMEISRIDKKKVKELSQWDVDQILAGKRGERVLFEWKYHGRKRKAVLSFEPN